MIAGEFLEEFPSIIWQPASKINKNLGDQIMKNFHPSIPGVFFVVILVVVAFAANAVAQTVSVNNVEDLYAAVNDPANAGSTVVLASGVYMLSANDPNGVARPNKGRLDLLENMSLLGVVGDRSAVVIDASNLPASSFTGSPGPIAAIRMGRGANSIQWLTVRNAANGQANIDVGLQEPGTAYVTIAHVESYGSARGLNVLNFGSGASGETIEVDIVDNDFHDNVLGVGEGMRVGNFQGATGATINARIVGNRSWGNIQGRLLVNNRAINSTVNVFSSGNRFFNNGLGTAIIGALSSNATSANGNTINFEGHGDQFVDNNMPTILDVGGLVVLGGENISIPNGTNNNTVNVSLWGCRMADNNTHDLVGIGARSNPESIGPPGVNNHVTITIQDNGSSNGRWNPVEEFANSVPFDVNATNSVTVIR